MDSGLKDWRKFISQENQELVRERCMALYRDRLIGFQELANEIGICVITLDRFMRKGKLVKWKTLHKILDWVEYHENGKHVVN